MKTRITLRLQKSTHEQLKAIAEENKRSLNGQIEFIIENFINQKYSVKENKKK